MIDEIVANIFEEDQRVVVAKMESQKENKKALEKYLKERSEWKKIEQQRLEEENRKIQQFAEKKIQKQLEEAKKKKVVQDEKNRVFEKVIGYYFFVKLCRWLRKWRRSKGNKRNMKISKSNWLLLKKKKREGNKKRYLFLF
jgi:hypothetical protein